MASSGVSSGVFTGSDFSIPVSKPKPVVTPVDTSRYFDIKKSYPLVTNGSYNITNLGSAVESQLKSIKTISPSYSDVLKSKLPSGGTVLSTVKTGLSSVSKLPKWTIPTVVGGAVAGGVSYGLDYLFGDNGVPVSDLKPTPPVAPTASNPTGSTPQAVNEKTVQIINNFSPEILGKLKVESDTDLITALIKASVAQNQSTIMNTAVLNAQLGLLNEQFFGVLAYFDLFLSAFWDHNELISLNTASNYDVASNANAANDTIAESVLRVGDKLSHFSENQEWLQTLSPIPSLSSDLSPREAEFAKNYQHGKGEADTNSIGTDTIEMIDSLLDDMDISPTMLKSYVRIDTILDQARKVAEGDSDTWNALMEELYR